LNEHWIDAPLIHEETAMPGQGSAGNVIAAVCSFFIPGLGQLVQGRLLMAAVHLEPVLKMEGVLRRGSLAGALAAGPEHPLGGL
jgi:hypothetical protein